MKVLLLDCHLDEDSWGAPKVRRWLTSSLSNIQIDTRRPPDRDLPRDTHQYSGIVLSGSRTRIGQDLDWIREYRSFLKTEVQKETPLFGICYGFQLLAQTLGGDDIAGIASESETGMCEVKTETILEKAISHGLPRRFSVYQNHHDSVFRTPLNCIQLFSSKACPIQGFQHLEIPVAGVQFHPENTSSTEEGPMQILLNNIVRNLFRGSSTT